MIIMNPPSSSTDEEPSTALITSNLVKEEMDDDDSSPPLLPIRPTPTSLFQPFLPRPSSPPSENNNKPLTFSIDNILRPSFGLSNVSPTGFFSSPFLHNSFMAAAAFAAAAAAAAAKPISAASANLATPLSPTLSTTSSTSSSTPTPVKKEPKPVDLSTTSSTASSTASSSSKNDNELPNGVKRDEDCPPGMVRGPNGQLWPAWVFCTRYSDRPSSGPRSRRIKKPSSGGGPSNNSGQSAEKRPRTAFSADQLARLKQEFEDNRYLTEERRRNLALELGLNENQIKIWFQNKRAKIKKSTGQKGELAQMLMAQGLYNHSTIPVDDEDNPIF